MLGLPYSVHAQYRTVVLHPSTPSRSLASVAFSTDYTISNLSLPSQSLSTDLLALPGQIPGRPPQHQAFSILWLQLRHRRARTPPQLYGCVQPRPPTPPTVPRCSAAIWAQNPLLPADLQAALLRRPGGAASRLSHLGLFLVSIPRARPAAAAAASPRRDVAGLRRQQVSPYRRRLG